VLATQYKYLNVPHSFSEVYLPMMSFNQVAAFASLLHCNM